MNEAITKHTFLLAPFFNREIKMLSAIPIIMRTPKIYLAAHHPREFLNKAQLRDLSPFITMQMIYVCSAEVSVWRVSQKGRPRSVEEKRPRTGDRFSSMGPFLVALQLELGNIRIYIYTIHYTY